MRERPLLAVGDRAEPRRVDAVLDEVGLDRVGAALAEREVVLDRPALVAVPLEQDVGARVVDQHLAVGGQARPRVVPQDERGRSRRRRPSAPARCPPSPVRGLDGVVVGGVSGVAAWSPRAPPPAWACANTRRRDQKHEQAHESEARRRSSGVPEHVPIPFWWPDPEGRSVLGHRFDLAAARSAPGPLRSPAFGLPRSSPGAETTKDCIDCRAARSTGEGSRHRPS